MKILQKEILKTLLFFNFHNRPLNLKEIHQFLGVETSESKVFLVLMNLVKNKKIIEKNKFFVLTKYKKLFQTFEQRLEIQRKLIKKAKNFSFLFRLTPFVRGVFLANSLAMGLPSKVSDIDIVILTKKNRLWIARFFLNIFFLFFGQRRRKNLTKDPERFCLSCFVEYNISLDSLKLKQDPLLIYWLITLKPFLGFGACEKFLKANRWIRNFLPNFQFVTMGNKIKSLSFFAFLEEKIIDLFGDQLEKLMFKIQAPSIGAKNKKDDKLALPYIYKSYPRGGRKKLIKKLKTLNFIVKLHRST